MQQFRQWVALNGFPDVSGPAERSCGPDTVFWLALYDSDLTERLWLATPPFLWHLLIYRMHIPASALFNTLPVIPLFFIISKPMKQFARKLSALPTVFQLFFFTARFHRAAVSPERLFDLYTAFAVHLFPIFTRAA